MLRSAGGARACEGTTGTIVGGIGVSGCVNKVTGVGVGGSVGTVVIVGGTLVGKGLAGPLVADGITAGSVS